MSVFGRSCFERALRNRNGFQAGCCRCSFVLHSEELSVYFVAPAPKVALHTKFFPCLGHRQDYGERTRFHLDNRLRAA